jgi:hypothetical protein
MRIHGSGFAVFSLNSQRKREGSFGLGISV